jgi:hypothetical protein
MYRFPDGIVSSRPRSSASARKTSVLGQIVGGWQLGGVFLFQSGAFQTVTVSGADPSGGFPAADRNGGSILMPVLPSTRHQDCATLANPAAFAVRRAISDAIQRLRSVTLTDPVRRRFRCRLQNGNHQSRCVFKLGSSSKSAQPRESCEPEYDVQHGRVRTISNVQSAEERSRQIQSRRA